MNKKIEKSDLDNLKQFIIGIAGVSRAGKSELARKMAKYMRDNSYDVFVLSLDDFVLPEDQIPTIRGMTDWEHPSSVDWDRVIKEIKVCHSDILLIEGIFLYHEVLVPHLNKRINITIDKDTFLQRRLSDKRWGIEPTWYLEYVWKSNCDLNQPVDDDIIRNGKLPMDVMDLINEMLPDQSPLFRFQS